MRLALVTILALMGSPVLACDVGEDCDPPSEPPTVETPTFDPPPPVTPDPPPPVTPDPPPPVTPDPPPPVTPDPPPPVTPEKPDEPRETRVVPKSKPKPVAASCPKVKCVTDANGHRRAMFTADVPADMYYLGRNFCASAPKDVEVTACCLANPNQTYQIQYNMKVSKKAHRKAKEFCICVLGLD